MDIASGTKKKELWEHPQFRIIVAEKYPDGAYKKLQFELKDLPGVTMVTGNKELSLSFDHLFHILLPREYPQNLAKIQIVNQTPLYHPRIRGTGTKACYTVNGEVDRILIDIIFNILMRPETVRPPSLYKDADWGLDAGRMKWYIQYGPENLFLYLKQEWGRRQNKKSKVVILDK